MAAVNEFEIDVDDYRKMPLTMGRIILNQRGRKYFELVRDAAKMRDLDEAQKEIDAVWGYDASAEEAAFLGGLDHVVGI